MLKRPPTAFLLFMKEFKEAQANNKITALVNSFANCSSTHTVAFANCSLNHIVPMAVTYIVGLKTKEGDLSSDEWQRFVTLVKQSQELRHVLYHKLYDILKQHQHEVNEIRAEKIARVANPLALVTQQQQVYHPQTHPTHYNQHSSTRTHQPATRKREKAIVNSPEPIYDQEPSMVDDDEDTNAGYESQMSGTVTGARETVGSSMVQKFRIQCYNCKEYGHVARECQKPKRAKDAAYHREKMLLCKQEEAGIQLNAE
nr:retrovirus-related Pol polyprotein from transposon TNT 1-94 [Tanacetum cinerariifolium]